VTGGRLLLAALAALAACARATPRPAALPAPAPARVEDPVAGRGGIRQVLEVDFAHAYGPAGRRDETVARTVAVLQKRADRLFNGAAVVRAAGDRVEVFLPEPREESLARFNQVRLSRGQFQVRLVDDGSAYMTALAQHVSYERPAGVDVRSERWSTPHGGPEHEDVYLGARNRADLVDPLARFTATNPLPPDREILLERWEAADPIDGSGWRTYFVWKQSAVDGGDVANAEIQAGWEVGLPEVRIDLTAEGRRKLSELTAAAVGRKIAVVVDGVVRSAPIVLERIPGGRAHLMASTRNADAATRELQDLVTVLRSGELPAPLVPLGEDQLPRR
jgi:preprotein translocase subunit SecD